MLHWTNLVTEEESFVQIPSHKFALGCTLTELPGGSLFITGGDPTASLPFTGENPGVNDVARIDALREYAVSHLLPMQTARYFHCAVYHSQHLYVVGGYAFSTTLQDCERYSFADKRWTCLPPLPRGCFWMNGVVMEGGLYIIGGNFCKGSSDLIYRLRLDELVWEVLQTKLPQVANCMALFTHDNQIYFVVNDSLYSLHPLQTLKILPKEIAHFYGPSYYTNGKLYCSGWSGPAEKMEIGSLVN
jgi:hypothetical protein